MLSLLVSKLSHMTTYGERLEEALRWAKKDRAQLGAALQISVQAIGQVIAGKTKALTAENSAKAARFLNVDHYWLATGEGQMQLVSRDWPFEGLIRYEDVQSCDRAQLALIAEVVRPILEQHTSKIPAPITKGVA